MNSYLQKYSDSEASFLKKRLQQHVLTLYVSTTLAYLDFCQQILVLHPGFSEYLLWSKVRLIGAKMDFNWIKKKKKKVNVPIKKWKEKNNNFSEVNKGVWVQEF